MDNKTKIIIGLGNPGKQYKDTRHNFGSMVIDNLVEIGKSDFRAGKGPFVYTKQTIENQELILCKPICFMNNSGVAVKMVLNQFELLPDSLLIVYDDIDLNLGKIRLRKKGSAGGHNGLKSIIEKINTDLFSRLRLGIGPQKKNEPSEEFVLSNFRKDEKKLAEEIIDLSGHAVKEFAKYGITSAMNKYNPHNLSLEKEVVV